ncbi:diguanylate phosphodiesterase [Pseudomonas sp. CFA]|nr:diguanylate phosphodiesterase [Pseudomonas sp. CFA]
MSNHRGVSTTNLRRSGFTREYGSAGNGERRVEIGQQARPLRGLNRPWNGGPAPPRLLPQ